MSTKLLRKLAVQRSVSLYVDQEKELALICEKECPENSRGLVAELVRQGVDLVIKKYNSSK